LVAYPDSQDANVAHVIDRLIQATEGKSISALAGLLGVSHQAVYNAKNKGKIPKAWFVEIWEATGISVDWLLTGSGPTHQTSGEVAEESEASRVTPPAACSRCEKLETELSKERDLNRELVAENRQLWKENGDLRVALERAKARAAPDDTTLEDARNCA
jgi:Bacteriophage CI repressor helix-turn-helix domain.